MARHWHHLPPLRLIPAAGLLAFACVALLPGLRSAHPVVPAAEPASSATQVAVRDFQACIAHDIATDTDSGCDLALEPAIDVAMTLAVAAREGQRRNARSRAASERSRGGGATQRAVALPFFSFRS